MTKIPQSINPDKPQFEEGVLIGVFATMMIITQIAYISIVVSLFSFFIAHLFKRIV